MVPRRGDYLNELVAASALQADDQVRRPSPNQIWQTSVRSISNQSEAVSATNKTWSTLLCVVAAASTWFNVLYYCDQVS